MRSQIKAAGDYLLSVLKAEKEVVYSRFYNAEPGTDVALVHGMWPFLMSQPVEQRGELDDGDRGSSPKSAKTYGSVLGAMSTVRPA